MIKITDSVSEWSIKEREVLVEAGYKHHNTWPKEDEFADFYEKRISDSKSIIIDKQGGYYYTCEGHWTNGTIIPTKFKKIKKINSIL
jgi:hypothetical protein